MWKVKHSKLAGIFAITVIDKANVDIYTNANIWNFRPIAYIPFPTISNLTVLIYTVMTVALLTAIFATTHENDKSLKWKLCFYGWPVIASCSLGSNNDNSGGGRWLVGGRQFLRFSKDTKGSITLCSTSTSKWIMTLFAMATFNWIVPLLSLWIIDPWLKFTHCFLW